ncbi:unnamed protein product [Caenorhabditis auriculariae]|uniref:Uncharacterized protein n=1 Tax=Caenorhabditis auriculariae TaxID=2777116 RepID=A0A8S1HV44_9PELO|nr:unnamed protein product [Caenorhabditis auriculariae]
MSAEWRDEGPRASSAAEPASVFICHFSRFGLHVCVSVAEYVIGRQRFQLETYSPFTAGLGQRTGGFTCAAMVDHGGHDYVLDPTLLAVQHHMRSCPLPQPPRYEDALKQTAGPPKYQPSDISTTPSLSIELPTSDASTARLEDSRFVRGNAPSNVRRTLSDPCGIGMESSEEDDASLQTSR